MRPALLLLDDALASQQRLLGRAREDDACEITATDLGPALRLWSRKPALHRLAERLAAHLPASEGPRLVFAGSGDFHHATPALIARALEATPGPVTLVHIDNHPDWVRYANGMHCGSWVNDAARMPDVSRVITLGVCSADAGEGRHHQADFSLITSGRLRLFPYRSPDGGIELIVGGRPSATIETLGLDDFIERLLPDIVTDAVYITIDKDVLRKADAATNWDQGLMSANELLAILKAVMGRHRVIGADVVGDWSKPIYGGGVLAAVLKRGEAMLDQPWRPPNDAARINEAMNLRLLDLFAEAA